MERNEENEKIPISQRQEWSDVTLIPQDDGLNLVVPIAYKDDFTETINYFIAVYFSDKRSPRSFHLTAKAIYKNIGNYTVWHFKRLILEALNAGLHEELNFIKQVDSGNPKCT